MTENDDMKKIEIWNDMVKCLSSLEYPTGDKLLDDAFTVFQYYSEMESGGHEAFLNWFSEDMRKTDFGQRLIIALDSIGAVSYAAIEREYGTKLLQEYTALEQGDGSEEAFYKRVEKADNAYYALDGQLAELLEAYFIEIHNQVIQK